MESREHAVIGAVVSGGLVVAWWPDATPVLAIGLWIAGVVLSVFVDLDHFVVARLLAGDWRHLRRALSRPFDHVRDQSWVFPEDEDIEMSMSRLLSHVLLAGVLTAAVWPFDSRLAGFFAFVLYAHVLADLLRETEIA